MMLLGVQILLLLFFYLPTFAQLDIPIFKSEKATPSGKIIEWKQNKKSPVFLQQNFDSRGRLIEEVEFNGEEKIVRQFFPNADFINVSYLTEGQASTCLLAEKEINNDEELLIAGCDNGMVFDQTEFDRLKKECSCIVFTHRGHDLVLEKPDAYGWVDADQAGNVNRVSVKKTISSSPLNDHAIVATFWFKHGKDFVKAAKQIIEANDRVKNEFYVDQVINYFCQSGIATRVFKIEKYLCWGTPRDYEDYENTLAYWQNFLNFESEKEKC